MKAGWVCKKCKGKFPTMAEMRYHKCVPKKFELAPKKRKQDK